MAKATAEIQTALSLLLAAAELKKYDGFYKVIMTPEMLKRIENDPDWVERRAKSNERECECEG